MDSSFSLNLHSLLWKEMITMFKWIRQWRKKRDLRRKGEALRALLDGNYKKHR